jgi:hydantoinase/carbamoylase family amidase
MPKISPAIDLSRLRALHDGINRFGRNTETGGFNRTGFSDADMDGPANGPCLLVGSHLDTVPEGGAFDGSLGVAVAFESVRALRDAGIEPNIAIEVVATAEEEGRFGGMLGSQAIVGAASAQWIWAAMDADGVSLADAMRAQALSPERFTEARRFPEDVAGFMELHIEQGPVLEQSGLAVGIVDAVSGINNLDITFVGEANHSGTTPMDSRHDAFAGLAALANAIPDILREWGTAASRLTIGKVDLQPNFPHTVPGLAHCVVNIRDTDEASMRAITGAVRDRAEKAAQMHGLGIEIEEMSWLSPVRLDAGLVELMSQKADELGLPIKVMPSGAGHDAQTMQSLCPSALIFLRSRGGISHAPEEWSDWADVEEGARLYLAALTELALRR